MPQVLLARRGKTHELDISKHGTQTEDASELSEEVELMPVAIPFKLESFVWLSLSKGGCFRKAQLCSSLLIEVGGRNTCSNLQRQTAGVSDPASAAAFLPPYSQDDAACAGPSPLDPAQSGKTMRASFTSFPAATCSFPELTLKGLCDSDLGRFLIVVPWVILILHLSQMQRALGATRGIGSVALSTFKRK